jgi:hypothetical protein
MFEKTKKAVADLAGSLTADPQSQDHEASRSLFTVGEKADAKEPSDDIEDYRDLYENNPVVRTAINTFVQEVLEPGYGVEGANDELREWLSDCAFVGGQENQPFYLLLKQTLTDREVAGSALIEKVPAVEDDEALAALKLFRAETTRAYTRPTQNILVQPDDDFEDSDRYPTTDGDDLAAFVQFDDAIGFDERDQKEFTTEDVVLITRDQRTGDVWGTSRLKAIQKRADGMLEKLDHSDRAVKTMAYPHRVLRFGDEEYVWSDDEIKGAIQKYDVENFEPGMTSGLPFDVNVEEYSGELPELRENIKTDVDVIMSGMPIPKYELGGFEENINQFVSRSQERRQQQKIEEARRELERELTPVLQQKAEEIEGVDSEEVRLVIGEESDEGAEDTTPEEPDTEPVEDSPETPGDDPEQNDMSVWGVDTGEEVADLADPRFVSTNEEVRELRQVLSDALTRLRDDALDAIEDDAERIAELSTDRSSQRLSERIESTIRRVLTQVIQEENVDSEAEPIINAVVVATLDKLASSDSEVQLDTSFGLKDRQAVQFYSENVENQVKDAADDMYANIRTQVRRGIEDGESYADIRRRIEQNFDDSEIQNRAGLIARMEVQNAVNGTRIREYEDSNVVAGVELINPCGPDTTRLCRDLACTGDAKAFFDEGSLSDQWTEQAPADAMFDGFRPLPETPPFHWNCRTGVVPITESSREREDLSTRYTEGDEVETPEGMGVVTDVRTSNFEGPDGSEVEASESSPTYIIAVESGATTYSASEIESGEIEVDVENPEETVAREDMCGCEDMQDGFFQWPESWRESEQPARMIALKAWSGMGGTFRGCRREMTGEIARPNAFCADMKDRILGWEGWRNGG